MRALSADPLSARWRSWVLTIWDRSGDVCLRLALACFDRRDRLAPDTERDLTPAAADRILHGVLRKIADESTQRAPLAYCCGQSFASLEEFAAHAPRCTLAVTLRATIVAPTSARHWGHA